MNGYTYKDNTKQVLSALEKAKRRGLKAIGMTAEGYAKESTPVDTGLLRNSITFALDGENPSISSYRSNNGEAEGKYDGKAPKEKGPRQRGPFFFEKNSSLQARKCIDKLTHI